MIAPAAGPWNAWPAPKNTERTKMCHSSTASVIASTPRTATAMPRSALEKISTLRRSNRSATTPPTRTKATIGIVSATPTTASAVGEFQRSKTCQAIATRKKPSPISETVQPSQKSAKSRSRNGWSNLIRFTRELRPRARARGRRGAAPAGRAESPA